MDLYHTLLPQNTSIVVEITVYYKKSLTYLQIKHNLNAGTLNNKKGNKYEK